MQRFTAEHPCPICGGHKDIPGGHGQRCWGFRSADGQLAHCTRDEYAGRLSKSPNSEAFAHRLIGDCACGIRHAASPPRHGSNGAGSRKKIMATYDYVDEDGQFLFQVVRYQPKDFRQRRRGAAGQWVWNIKGVRLVPYRLPELLTAIRDERIIFIPEGEKDSDSLWNVELPATTNAMGAGKWPVQFSEYFHGARVVLLPHHDAPGRAHETKIAADLTRVASWVKRLDLDDLPEHGDVSDWLAAGHTAGELLALVEATPALEAHVASADEPSSPDGEEAPRQAEGTTAAEDPPTSDAASVVAQEILATLQKTPDPRLIYQKIDTLADLPTEEWGPFKSECKNILAAQLNLTDLEKARKEAKRRRVKVARPRKFHGAAATGRRIQTNARQLPEITAEGLGALRAHQAKTPAAPLVYVRGGVLQRLVVDEEGHERIEVFTESALKGVLARVAEWYQLVEL